MAGTRKVAAVVLAATLGALAMLAWWSMLAAERAAVQVGRFSHVITAAAFLVMACSVTMLLIVARDRRRAHVEVSRLGRRWEEAAADDDLTGLGNRTRLLEDTAALISRGSRYGSSFGLAVFELPGEPSDGLVLTVSELLASEARGADLCYRVGDGRFVTLLPWAASDLLVRAELDLGAAALMAEERPPHRTEVPGAGVTVTPPP